VSLFDVEALSVASTPSTPERPAGATSEEERAHPREASHRSVGPEATRRVVLVIAYNGAGFHGFAPQPGQRTVAGVLSAALSDHVGHGVTLTAAGRTDTGVHALGQVIHVDLDLDRLGALRGSDAEVGERVELPTLARRLSSRLGPEIAVLRAFVAPETFDARRSAVSRRYRYQIFNAGAVDPLSAGTSWHVPARLNLRAMQNGADLLLGERDFAPFCRRPPDRASGPLLRRVRAASFRAVPDTAMVVFEIEASAFCHQMVRSIVGMLVSLGTGRHSVADLVVLLRSGSRDGAPTLAPPHGLVLLEVSYPPDLVTPAELARPELSPERLARRGLVPYALSGNRRASARR